MEEEGEDTVQDAPDDQARQSAGGGDAGGEDKRGHVGREGLADVVQEVGQVGGQELPGEPAAEEGEGEAWQGRAVRAGSVVIDGAGFQEEGGEGGAEGQGVEGGDQGGGGDGEGELAVELADDARDEGTGDEDGGEHQADGDDGSGDVAHGLDRRFFWSLA